MNVDLNDMYIEDAASAFGQLDDNASEEIVETNSMGAENVEADDLYDEDDDVDFDQVTDDGEPDDSENKAVEEDESEVAEEEEEGDAEEEVDFEEYEVTLPSGESVKLHEAIKGYRDAQALEAERAAFEETKQTFETSSRNVKRVLDLAKLEAERVIEDYEGFDWATLSREDPQAYVENREFLDKYKSRHREIQSEMERVEGERQEQKDASFREDARKANEVLSNSIPGWNKDLYVGLMTYGVKDLGMTEDFVVNCTDPGVFMAIHKAQTLDKGKQTVKAKIKKLSSPTPQKVVKAQQKTTKVVDNKKANMQKKIATGQFDQNDLANAFDMLED